MNLVQLIHFLKLKIFLSIGELHNFLTELHHHKNIIDQEMIRQIMYRKCLELDDIKTFMNN